tara:strand:- start:36863 stop:39874 length:3012 start_codon:yes stop_codon:yes gene_type:complete
MLFSKSIVFAQSDFYYYNDKKVDLEINRSYLNIIVTDSFDGRDILPYGFQVFDLWEYDTTDSSPKYWAELNFISTPTEMNYLSTIASIKNIPGVNVVAPHFNRGVNNSIGTSDIFYVKLNQAADVSVLQSLANNYDVDIIGANEFMPLWYKLMVRPSTLYTTVELTNIFYETNSFDKVDPAFIFKFETLCANDPDFVDQWGLNNTTSSNVDINICDAWNITEGVNTIVAVVDSRIDSTHIDLSANLLPNEYDSTGGITSTYGTHGTAVAGVIGAVKDNGIFISGVSPNTQIMRVYHHLVPELPNTVISEELANGINWAWQNGADVINNSWGDGGGNYYDYFHSALLENAIEDAMVEGRSGLGTLVVFGAGNQAAINYPAYFHPDIVVVGAIDKFGDRGIFTMLAPPGESAYGPELDLVAPGVEITTTFDNNTIGVIEGTSFAAPHVSGVVALILSVNPCLSLSQVNNILESTSQKLSTYTFENYNDRPNGSWNEEVGYGLLDAHAAVVLAEQMGSVGLDLMVKDGIDDFGLEPNTTTEILWESTDIWVRNEEDGIDSHQNPEYDPVDPNYIYTRVTNKSCATSSGNDVLKLYWAKANTALLWDDHWDGSLIIDGVVMGDEVGDIIIPVLAPGEEIVLSIPWLVPNPDDYLDNDNPWHFCLLARIESGQDPMTFPEVPFLPTNVSNNNNIAWKNLTIVDIDPLNPGFTGATVGIGNNDIVAKPFILEFKKKSTETGKAIYEAAEVTVTMDDVLWQGWTNGGESKENLDDYKSTSHTKIILGDSARLNNVIIPANTIATLHLDFNFLVKEVDDKHEFTYYVIQRDAVTDSILGGETYLVRKQPRNSFTADGGDDMMINNDESVTLTATDIYEAAVYNWYDYNGNLIHTGTEITLSPEITQQYQLEVIAEADGFKDYDEVTIAISPFSILSLTPNPAIDFLTVNYNSETADTAYLMIIGNNTSQNYMLDTEENTTVIDVSSYSSGYYIVALVCDGDIVDTKNLIKN